MRVTLLGTGTSQGVPVIACKCNVCRSEDSKDKRLRSAILVEEDNTRIVVDCGPDFRQQMLRHEVENLDAILLTHEHADHIFGLDDIRSFNWLRKSPMDIYCEPRVQNSIKNIFKYVFAANKIPGTPQMDLIDLENKEFKIGSVSIIPIRVLHLYLPVFGFRFGQFAYLTDFNMIEEQELEKLYGIDTLVICALRKTSHVSHLNLSGALELIEKITPRKAYLTHMSHEMGKHCVLMDELPPNIEPAYDGLVLEI
ncbi:MAG: MBL fold metallo-hydrolase [Bacteroidia bacterium]|nr:MBL fold metallo-hydrolase [Bacteroidia bacterium]